MPQDLAPSIASEPAAIAGVVVILVLSLSWHEAAHAWVADRLGDPTARELGRVSLNPLRHLDPFLSVLLPAMLIIAGSPIVFGGGKPVPINVMNFRHRARDFMLVALAGPGSNLLLAAAFGALFVVCAWTGLLPPVAIADPYLDAGQRLFAPSITELSDNLLQYCLQMAVLLNLVLAIFNLMPIPPLDGSRLVGWLLPRALQPRWYALDRIGLFLVIAVVFFLGGQTYLGLAVEATFSRLGSVIDSLTGLLVS